MPKHIAVIQGSPGSLRRNILRFCGIKPIKETLIGMVEKPDERGRAKWLARMAALGRQGA